MTIQFILRVGRFEISFTPDEVTEAEEVGHISRDDGNRKAELVSMALKSL